MLHSKLNLSFKERLLVWGSCRSKYVRLECGTSEDRLSTLPFVASPSEEKSRGVQCIVDIFDHGCSSLRVQGNVWIPKPRWFVKFNTLMRPCSEGKHHFQQIPPSDFVFWVSLPPSERWTLSTKMWCKWVKSWYLCPYFIIHHSILAHLIWWFFFRITEVRKILWDSCRCS